MKLLMLFFLLALSSFGFHKKQNYIQSSISFYPENDRDSNCQQKFEFKLDGIFSKRGLHKFEKYLLEKKGICACESDVNKRIIVVYTNNTADYESIKSLITFGWQRFVKEEACEHETIEGK